MATTYTTIEIWVLIDEQGDYAVGNDAETASQRFTDDVGDDLALGRRMVKLTVKVPLPTTIELTGEVEIEEEVSELKTA